jgi:hypothetical protein
MKIIAAIIVIVAATGCASISVDRSRNSSLWEPFEYGQTYELADDMFLIALNGNTSTTALVPPRQLRAKGSNCYQQSGFYSAPETIAEYQEAPDGGSYTNVLGIVTTGTSISLSKLTRAYQFSLWYGFEKTSKRYALILSGQFKDEVVNIDDLHWDVDRYLRKQ